MTDTRTRTLAAGASLALLVGAVGFVPAAAATSEQVAIPGAEYEIPATLVMPDGEGPSPAVLMLHGYGSSADEVGGMYARLADSLAAQPERVGVQGFSMGSMIGSQVAGTDPRVRAFGSWSGAIYDRSDFFYGPETLEQCEADGHLDMDLGWRTLDRSCEFFSSHSASTSLTDFAPFAGDLLLIADTADESVDPAVSENAATASASENVTLELIEGGDHIFAVLTDDQS